MALGSYPKKATVASPRLPGPERLGTTPLFNNLMAWTRWELLELFVDDAEKTPTIGPHPRVTKATASRGSGWAPSAQRATEGAGPRSHYVRGPRKTR